MSLLSSLISSQKVVSLSPQTTVYQACQTMSANNIGSILVMEKDQLKGIFTERDLLNKVISKGLNYQNTLLDQVMTKNVATISIDESVENAFKKMETIRCRRLPIISNNVVVGMVTMRNILEWLINEMEDENVQLKRYIQS